MSRLMHIRREKYGKLVYCKVMLCICGIVKTILTRAESSIVGYTKYSCINYNRLYNYTFK